MILEVMTDFEMTFTDDLYKVACENNDFVFKVSIPQKTIGFGPLENSGELYRAILALLLNNTHKLISSSNSYMNCEDFILYLDIKCTC